MSDWGRELAALRGRVDEVDDRLVALIQERLTIARELGRLKASAGQVGPDEPRQAAIIERLSAHLPARDVEAIWGALFAASLRAQAEEGAPPD